MQEDDETPPDDTQAMLAAARPSWQHRARLGAVLLLAVGASGVVGGALPSGTSYSAMNFGVIPHLADPDLQEEWKPVSAYVTERNITPAMLAHERLQHEAKQIELLTPPEVKELPPVRAPLLPGRVQKLEVAVPAPVISESPFATTPDDAAAAVQAAQPVEPAKPTREQKFNEDLSTLEALRNALKTLKAEEKTSIEGYRNDR